MKVAVTDANIFIDLINLKLISHLFELEFEVHTSLEVLDELFDHQQEILSAYKSAKKLTVHILSETELEEMHEFANINKLSDADKTVIYLAKKLKAMLLSSDGPARKFAKQKKLDTHGLIWLFDQLVETKTISTKIAILKAKELLATNRRYREDERMVEEFNKRIDNWSE